MQPCPHCKEDIPGGVDYCPFCKSTVSGPAKSRDAAADKVAASMTSKRATDLEPPTSLFSLWVTGIIGSIVGAVLIYAGADSDDAGILIVPGILLAAVGGVILQVAVIASGVFVGLRNRDRWDDFHRAPR